VTHGELQGLSQRHALELVIFDIAGTTVEDHGQVPNAFAAALAELGMTVTPEQIKHIRGSSKRQALLSFIPPGPQQAVIAEEVYTSFRNLLSNQYTRGGVRAIPGAERVFQILRDSGVKLALNTGFDRDITGLILAALGWTRGIVDAVVCGDEVAHGRPAPDMIFRAMEAVGVRDVLKVANVGDTVLDLQAGHHASVRWNIGVLSGAHDRRILEGAPHTHLLPSIAELPTLWSDT
jgi:phosphonatase-like hydrolase